MPGPWGVKQLPKDGDSYLGLTAREDKTYESISCKLPTALQKDSCYTFKVDLCRATSYAGYNGVGILGFGAAINIATNINYWQFLLR
jgi:hypothetical protein